MNANEITNQVQNFIKFVNSGWKTELAFDCCYDMIYDQIGAEEFLNLCQKSIKIEHND